MSARKLAPANNYYAFCLRNARESLRRSLELAERANCPRLAAKIRSALKSADGARRHMERRIAATEKPAS